MKSLLNREDSKKVSLFRFIEKSTQQIASFSAIMFELDLSEFVLLRLAENLVKDIELNDLISQLQITIYRTQKTIHLKMGYDASVSMLYVIYMKNSLNYNILDDILNRKLISMTDFSEYNFTSYSSVQKKIQEVKKELAKYQISVSPKYALIGKEINIRMFFYNLYFPRFNQLNFPFEAKFEKLAKEFIKLFEKHLGHAIQETLKTKLKFFLSISLKRVNMKQYLLAAKIKKEKYIFNQEDSLYQMIYQFLFEEYRLLKKDYLANESESILAFIICETGTKTIEYSPIKEMVQVDDNLTSLFIRRLEERFKSKIHKDQRSLLIQELSILHFKLYFFLKVESVFGDLINVQYLEETYTDAYKYCGEFLNNLPKQRDCKLIEANSNFLFHQYLFLIVKIFPSKFFMEKIHICLDFSLGRHYTNIIETNLRNFSFFNIEITDYIHEDTDLFISNYIYKDVNVLCLVWNIPPTFNDWENLGKFLVKIKNEKVVRLSE